MLGAGKPPPIPQPGRKKWWKKKALLLPQKPWCEEQSAIPGSESKPKLSNHTQVFFFLLEPKAVPVRLYICSLINIGDFLVFFFRGEKWRSRQQHVKYLAKCFFYIACRQLGIFAGYKQLHTYIPPSTYCFHFFCRLPAKHRHPLKL